MAQNQQHAVALNWEARFARRNPKAYAAEDRERLQFVAGDQRSLITAICQPRKSQHLDPPDDFIYAALRVFLEGADMRILDLTKAGPSNQTPHVLIDERQDTKGIDTWVRLWDSVGENGGYLNYPPAGEAKTTKAVNLKELLEILTDLRVQPGKERRTLFIPDISPDCMLILVATVPKRTAPALRSFFQQYIQGRSYFAMSNESRYELEFHIPYFALRRGPKREDERKLHDQPLRKGVQLPLSRTKLEEEDYYYEAQISLLVTGVDEWLWTSHCIIDTYHGSERRKMEYLNSEYPTEPATGGSKSLSFPMWCPRLFFVIVLSRRLKQATLELKTLIDAFEERMNTYATKSMFRFTDDDDQSGLKELTLTITTISTFRDSITKTLTAWTGFEAQDIQVFELPPQDPRRSGPSGWDSHLASIRGNIKELSSYEMILSHRLETFKGMRTAMNDASALKESAAATRQGDFIKILTLMTVCYLPLGLSTGLFSMSIVPSDIHLAWFFVVSIALSVATALFASYSGIMKILQGTNRPYQINN